MILYILGCVATSITCCMLYNEYKNRSNSLPEDHPLVKEARNFALKNGISQNFYIVPSLNVFNTGPFSAATEKTVFTNYIHISNIYTSKTGIIDIVKNSDSIDLILDKCKIRMTATNASELDQDLSEIKSIINELITCAHFVIGHELGHTKEKPYMGLRSWMEVEKQRKHEHEADLISAKTYREQAFKWFEYSQKLNKISGHKTDDKTHPPYEKRIEYLQQKL